MSLRLKIPDKSDFEMVKTQELVFYESPFVQVVYLDEKFVGFCAVELKNDHFLIKKCHIDFAYRRRGYGTKLISSLKKRLRPYKKAILCEVPENDLEFQLFLKKNGFFCFKSENQTYYFEFQI